ncbi:MAG: GIY-YIG nuclease family protein [Candidatus Pacebacteria bacterium]|nr:GIY-YIG nuclease family protein [Candidatus Paceibacterota bacterium]
MYFVYSIKSLNKRYTYIGITDNIERRVNQHNRGYNRTTKPYAPFELILSESYGSRKEARKREKYLKSGYGRELIQFIVNAPR